MRRIFPRMRTETKIGLWQKIRIWFCGGTIVFVDDGRTVMRIPVARFTWVDVNTVGTSTVMVNWDER